MSIFPKDFQKKINNILVCADPYALELLLDQGLPISLSDKTDKSEFGLSKIAEQYARSAPHSEKTHADYTSMLDMLFERGAHCHEDHSQNINHHPFNPLWVFCVHAHSFDEPAQEFLEKLYHAGCDPRPGLAYLASGKNHLTTPKIIDVFQQWCSEYEKGIILQDISISNQHSKKKIM